MSTPCCRLVRTLPTFARQSLVVCLASAAAAATAENPPPDPDAEELAAERHRFVRDTDYPAAVKASVTGLTRARQSGDTDAEAIWLRRLASDHWTTGNLELAVDYARALLDLAERSDSNLNRAHAHRLLSAIHETLQQFPRALEHAVQAHEWAERAGNRAVQGLALTVLGRAERHAGNFDAAQSRFTASFEIWRRRSPWNAAIARRNLAEVDEARGDMEAALRGYERVARELAQLDHRRGLARTLCLAASLLRRHGRTDDARAQLERARPLAGDIASHEVRAEYFGELARLHETLGDYAAALAAERQATSARTALGVVQAAVHAADLGARVELARTQDALDRLARAKQAQDQALFARDTELRVRSAELARERAVRWSLAAVLLAAALASGAVILAQRARLRAERRSLAETHRARAMAEEASAFKSQIVGIASHDLKAPLRAIVARAELLEPIVQASPGHAATLGEIRAGGERMLALVRDLLDLSAAESGELKLCLAPCDLNEVATGIVAAHRLHARQKQIALQFAPPDGAILVQADRPRLEQAIDNLVDNALKFSPSGSSVHVDVAAAGGRARLAVRDEGPGIAAEDFARMFQPFQTLSAVPTAGEPSSGLGLHIAREIVARHGGRIDVDSAPGAGATFVIVLPAGAGAARGGPPGPGTASHQAVAHTPPNQAG